MDQPFILFSQTVNLDFLNTEPDENLKEMALKYVSIYPNCFWKF